MNSTHRILLIICLILWSANSFAQAPQAIPYQAVARDNSGNPISNQNISLQFTVHNGSAAGTVVYRETHPATTNALGLFTVNIGQGSASLGTFPSIDWGGGSKFIQVEMDVNNGNPPSYTDMGTTQMLSVPYALFAGSTGSGGGGTLDNAYDFGGPGVGRTINADAGAVQINGVDGFVSTGTFNSGAALTTAGAGARMIWYPKKAAFRAGYVDGTHWNDASIGDYSFASGFNSIAGGAYSTAMGHGTYASGAYSTAMGYGTGAYALHAIAMGTYTNASGWVSTAMGNSTTASGNYSTAMGSYVSTNSQLGSFAIGDISTSTIMNSSAVCEFSARFAGGYRFFSDAATTAANGMFFTGGNMGIGTATPAAKLDVVGNIKISDGSQGTDKVLTSDNDGLASWQTPASGVETDPEVGSNTASYVPVWNGTALTTGSIYDNGKIGIGTATPEFKLSLDNDGGILAKGTFGLGAALTTAGLGTRMIWYPKKAAFRAGYVNGTQWDDANIGDYSFASGYSTIAFGFASTAMGVYTNAIGQNSTAMGLYTTASGIYSTAMGYGTTASSDASTAMGSSTTASGEYSTAMGRATAASGQNSTAMGNSNIASGQGSTAMGVITTASGVYSTAMGESNTASGDVSTAMGLNTTASGYASTAMGSNTTASGGGSTAMGEVTTASGHNSTAMGRYVSTNFLTGSFVMGDASTSTYMNSSTTNQFSARFAGGYSFYSNSALTTGVLLAAGGGSWTSVSDRNKKENFREVNNEEVLVKISALPISNWNYKAQGKDIRHIGCMAQDFYAAFHLDGESDTTINTLDIDGIIMAAIQALKVRTDELKAAITELNLLKAEMTVMKEKNETTEAENISFKTDLTKIKAQLGMDVKAEK